MRGSGQHHQSGSRGNARTSSVRTPTRSNHASGSRHTSNRTSSVAAQTAATTTGARSNHGSGSRNHVSTARSTARSASSTVQTSSAPSSRHGSGSHASRSTARSASSTVQRESHHRESHHRESHHRESHHRESRTAATTTSQRENHSSGTHNHRREASMPSVAPLVAGAAISAISAVAGAAAAMAVAPATSSRPSNTSNTTTTSSAHGNSAPRPFVSNSASRTQRTDRQPEGRVNHGSGNHRRNAVTQHPEDDCCGSMCGILCALIKWILWPFYALVACIVCCKPFRASSARTGGSYSWWTPGLGLGLSTFLLLALVINSGNVNLMTLDSGPPVNADNLWTLFEGETQRVYLNKYVKSLKATVQDSSDRYMRAAVFNFDHHGCPPLTGPRVTLEHDWEFDMLSGGFEYVHYNLYRGSRIKVQFHSLQGVSDFYLLKGPKALEEIQKGTNTDPKHWKKISQIYRTNIAKGTDSYNDIDYSIKIDRGQDNDIFTLVFDNAYSREVSLDVVSDIIATTFDLGPYTPVCENMGSYSSCNLYATQQNCVILEAYSVGELEESNNKTVTSVGDSDRTITLKVDTYRDWKSIGILSAIPFCISLLVSIFFKCSSGNETTTVENVPQPLAEPLLPPDSERPPPTNPDHTPSAPLEPPMVEAIPIDTPK